jgi:uncharacterized protein with PIN domain
MKWKTSCSLVEGDIVVAKRDATAYPGCKEEEVQPMPCFGASSETEDANTRTSAVFLFHGRLNDFLKSSREKPIVYTFKNHPTVKHAVESIGIPHPEVGSVLIEKKEVGFSRLLTGGDRFDVFAVTGDWLYRKSILRRRYRGLPRFVLDVHLGTLARRLRLLGFDTLYSNRFHDHEIALFASSERRIVLTRDINLLMWCDVVYGCWVRSQDPDRQLPDVLDHFALRPWIQPFHRCTVCNGLIERVERADVRDAVKPEIWEYHQKFYRCSSCGRIYWKGTHFQRMEQLVSSCAATDR